MKHCRISDDRIKHSPGSEPDLFHNVILTLELENSISIIHKAVMQKAFRVCLKHYLGGLENIYIM